MSTEVAEVIHFDDEITICPYCGTEPRGEALGCCGESSMHFETHFIKFDRSQPYKNAPVWAKEIHKYPYDFVNPHTGETHDEPCDETRSE